MLLTSGADVNLRSKRETALQVASTLGDGEMVQKLLDHNADINAEGGSYGNALQAAIVKGQQDVVQILLDRGADVNVRKEISETTPQATSISGSSPTVKIAQHNCADGNAFDGQSGSAPEADSFASGLDGDVPGTDDGTASQHASEDEEASEGEVPILMGIPDDDEDDDEYDDEYDDSDFNLDYQSPLRAASYCGNKRAAKMLLAKGAVVDDEKPEWGNALHTAREKNHMEVYEMLMKKNAEANDEKASKSGTSAKSP